MVAEMSASEKEAREEASQALEVAERSLGFNYSILILGQHTIIIKHATTAMLFRKNSFAEKTTIACYNLFIRKYYIYP